MKQMQELAKLQQQAQKIKEELSNIHIEAEVDGVVVTVNCEMMVVKVDFEDTSILEDKERLAKAIADATNKGLKKAQEVAAEKMQGVMGSLGLKLPGM